LLARWPNLIAEEDWQGWLFARTWAVATLSDPSSRVIAKDGTGGTPLLVSQALGSGELLCVNLSLGSQLMNVHPGAYRLLANLLSLREGAGGSSLER
jgi:hypothetical protein